MNAPLVGEAVPATTIDAGGHVWIAEGGVSDFTAEVLREMLDQRPGLGTAEVVHLLQHAARNHDATSPENLALVEAATDYVWIDDGNSLNGTAGLNGASDGFETSALAGPHAAGWAVAFQAMSADELDFSDTVTVLHVLGVGIDQVASPADFALRFLG